MAESDSHWGALAEHDDELAEQWDGFTRLPEPGENDVLDAFAASKHIDIPALVRVGARLSDPAVLAFACQGGIKYRHMEDGARWNSTGASFERMKIVRGRGEPDTVIVAEGETDGARLTMLFPECDVAILPAGAKRFQRSFAEQLLGYARVLTGLDNDDAGNVGAAKIAELVPQAVRFAPPDANDWCALPPDAAPPPLPEAGEVRRAGGIFFEDLAVPLRLALDGKLPEPEQIVDGLLYETGVHWLSGHPGVGKSIMALHIAQMVMADRPVVWIDYENGLDTTVRRLGDVDIDYDLAMRHFNYAWYPPKAETFLADVAEQLPGALVVFDSASKALQLAGLDENSPGEVTSWTVPIVQASKQHRLPVLVIDHVSKASKPRDQRYARGAGAKLADADVHLMMEVETLFNRTQRGLVCVHRHKDREGYLPHEQWFSIGDGNGKLPVLPAEAPVDVDDESEPAL